MPLIKGNLIVGLLLIAARVTVIADPQPLKLSSIEKPECLKIPHPARGNAIRV